MKIKNFEQMLIEGKNTSKVKSVKDPLKIIDYIKKIGVSKGSIYIRDFDLNNLRSQVRFILNSGERVQLIELSEEFTIEIDGNTQKFRDRDFYEEIRDALWV